MGFADDGLGVEVERDAQYVGVLDVEQVVVVQIVRLAAKGATDDLFAQQLGAEGAHPEYVRNRVGVPALGEHRDRDDAADLSAQAVFFADRVHHLAQQIGVGDVLGCSDVSCAFSDLAPEAVDLVGSHVAEVLVEGFPDSSCSLSMSSVRGTANGLPCSSKLLKQRQSALDQRLGLVRRVPA